MLDRYLNNLSVPHYTSKHPVHGPYAPNRSRTGFLQQADNEADMRQYLEEQVREQLFEEEAGGDTLSYDGSTGVATSTSKLSDHFVKTKSFAELASMYWDDITGSTWQTS